MTDSFKDATHPTLIVTGPPCDGTLITLESPGAEKVLGASRDAHLRLEADNVDAIHARVRWDAAVTGARPGEMCGLRWGDVDVERGEVRIVRRIVRVQPEPKVQDLTKTGKTRRIPLDPNVLDVLVAYRSDRETVAAACGMVLSPDAYVFSDTVDGTGFWRPDSTSRRFRQLRIDHRLDNVSLYSLRHQAATTMIDHGIDPKTVSERLGNSVATVLGTYTRARTDADRDAANLLGSLYADT